MLISSNSGHSPNNLFCSTSNDCILVLFALPKPKVRMLNDFVQGGAERTDVLEMVITQQK